MTCLVLVHLSTALSGLIQYLIMTCSRLIETCWWLIHDLFMFCSLVAHNFFTIFSQLIHGLFLSCSLLFCNLSINLFMSSSWLVHALFTTCSKLFPTCSQLLQDVFVTCSQHYHHFSISTKWVVHNLFTTFFYNFFTSFDFYWIT